MGDIALALDDSEDAVSYVLRLLRTAGFVFGRRAGASTTALPTVSPSRGGDAACGKIELSRQPGKTAEAGRRPADIRCTPPTRHYAE